jgi:hypothetical protein
MRILIACEFSETVRRAFRALGHDAWSCDLLPSEDDNTYHFQCDVREVIADRWDMMIGFPDCTYVCGSGLHWNKRRPERVDKTEQAVEFFKFLWNQPIERIALENPVGLLSTRICKPSQIIQPYQFGEDASKATCLWLKGLPKLQGTECVPPRVVNFPNRPSVRRWANQTDSGQNKLPPSADRWKLRAKTYPGIASAMASQWNQITPNPTDQQ